MLKKSFDFTFTLFSRSLHYKDSKNESCVLPISWISWWNLTTLTQLCQSHTLQLWKAIPNTEKKGSFIYFQNRKKGAIGPHCHITPCVGSHPLEVQEVSNKHCLLILFSFTLTRIISNLLLYAGRRVNMIWWCLSGIINSYASNIMVVGLTRSNRSCIFTTYINPCPAEPGYTLPLQTV